MKQNAKNLWILTEERPKKQVLQMIVEYFAKDQGCGFFGDSIRIIPILNEEQRFEFIYEVIGFSCARIKHIYIKTVSGSSSFIDFLVYYQEELPTVKDSPLYAIEETKTDDSESRNTGVFQRCSKFVLFEHYYPQAKRVMLYALQVTPKDKPTDTSIFGTRLLLTLGVEILGKNLDAEVFKPFTSIDEVIEQKNNMRRPPKGNVPILLAKGEKSIQISGRLVKSDSLAHDPNIGALSILAAVLRKLSWTQQIEIVQHGLKQHHLRPKNKFVIIANKLGITFAGLALPPAIPPKHYWRYDTKGEKLGTIFIHLVVENFTESYAVFENHAGCEKGYFKTAKGEHIPLAKYADRAAYKAGDAKQIIFIPDLVLLDIKEKEAITIEGKKYEKMADGIKELENYASFDDRYLTRYYPMYKIVKTVVLYGGTSTEIRVEVGFLYKRKNEMSGLRKTKCQR